MAAPILATKLYIPRPRPGAVLRPRLLQRLNRGLHGKFTLVCASAGFGKTTLVSQWIPQADRPAVWLSLDEGESAPDRFLAYFIAALQRMEDGFGDGLSTLLDAPQPPPLESVLTALLNALARLSQECILVLDDYHAIESPAVDNALAFLIEHLPPQLHLVITSREDPQLPLARLRARGQMNEVRAADLRFTPDEAAAFLHQMMDLPLSEAEVAALESRTEGWAAGLQLAALSLRGREERAEFVRAFAGDNRYIADYLVEEVLEQQPQAVRAFLLQTALLNRLSGPLCDAVTGQTGGAEMLVALERANLFVVPLDDSRGWYRYHHLFADVLRAHLAGEEPETAPAIHRRASQWYWENSLPGDALDHALAAPDYALAARFLELVWPSMERSRQSAAWLGWAQKLPLEIAQTRPVLCAAFGWALLDQGELEAGGVWLDRAEEWLKGDAGRALVVDQAQYSLLPGTVASGRAYCALAFGDVPGTIGYARQALDLLPQEEYLLRGSPAALLGLAFWANGQLAEADAALAEALRSFARAGNPLYAITGAYVLAHIRSAQGRRRAALATCEEALQMARDGSQPVVWGTADIYTGLAELCCEENQLAQAAAHLQRSQELGEQAGFPRWRYRWTIAQARLAAAEGDGAAALQWLARAEESYVRGPVPDARPPGAQKARLWLAQGRLAEARRWVQGAGLTPDDELSFLQEYGHITLARLLLADYRRARGGDSGAEALGLLERLLTGAEAGGRWARVIEILLLLAQTHAVQGNLTAALPPLQRALSLAEPEGYVRIFVDEGPPLARLLAEAASQGLASGYTERLLAAFDGAPPSAPGPSSRLDESPAESPAEPLAEPLIEPLSERELEVLALIAQGLSNQEICDRLYLALSTVKGHNRNIFGKLQVQRRTEAVARARELGLL